MSDFGKSWSLTTFKKANKVKTLEIKESPIQKKLFFELPNGVTGWVSKNINWDDTETLGVCTRIDGDREVLILCNLAEYKPAQTIRVI